MDPLRLESFCKEFEADTIDVKIGGRGFHFLTPRRIERFVDPANPFHNFPLWAKIWEASWVLADLIAGIPANPCKTILEIGAGMGLVGIVAACFGHRVVLTEQNPDALRFARANAMANGCQSLTIRPFDWHASEPPIAYDMILGSEIIYHRRDYPSLKRVFDRCLAPDGEIILAAAKRKVMGDFLHQLQADYAICAKQKTLRSDSETIRIILCRIKRN